MEYFHVTVFKGTYHHKIDPKGRLPVPAAFRRTLNEQGAGSVVVTQLDQCLAAWPPAVLRIGKDVEAAAQFAQFGRPEVLLNRNRTHGHQAVLSIPHCAAAAAAREGFPPDIVIFLDQEEGGRLLPEQAADRIVAELAKRGIFRA